MSIALTFFATHAVNFERVDDAIRARKALNGRDVLGSEVGAVRIGFAKVPVKNADEGFPGDPSTAGFAAAVDVLGQMKGASTISGEQQALSGNLENYRSNMILNLMQHKGTDAGSGSGATSGRPSPGIAGVQNALAAGSSSASIAPSSDKGGVPLPSELVPHPTTSEQQLIMRELSEGDPELQVDVDAVADLRPPAMYYTNIPLVSEVSSSRRFDTTKLREMRKSIDGGQCSQDDIDAMARDFMDDIVDLSSDYIGNTVVQKFFERCSEQVKQIMLERIAPHLAMIGIHKNGTWAAQKIIDCSKTPEQIALIAQNLAPYVPPLLLDQFGNYVVQCVIPYKSPTNEFVFNAMVDRCWEVAQGRFGARSMRACLENSLVTKRQQKRVAIAIILNSVPLATSPNGALLLTWLLDTSGLPGRYRLLAPRFAPHLSHLCNHKLASLTVLRIINQKAEPSASRIILKALFDSPHDQALEEVLTDQVHGSQCITKVLSSQAIDPQDKPRYADAVKRILIDNKLVGVPAYRRLVEDLGLPVGPPLAPRPNQDLRGAAPLAPQQAQFTGMLPPHTSYPADLNSMLAQMQGLQLQQGGQSLAGMMPAPNLGQGSGLALGQQGFGTSPIRLDSANSNAQNYLSSSNTDPFSPFARGNAGVDFSFNPVRGQASPPRGARRGGRGQNSSPIGGHGGFAQPSLMEHYLQNGYPQQGPNFP